MYVLSQVILYKNKRALYVKRTNNRNPLSIRLFAMPNSIVITVKKKLRSVGKSSINLGNQSILEINQSWS